MGSTGAKPSEPENKYSENPSSEELPQQQEPYIARNQDINQIKMNNPSSSSEQLEDPQKQRQMLISEEVDDLQKELIEKLNDLDQAMENFTKKIQEGRQQDSN